MDGAAPTRWSLARRIGARFVFVYFGLYFLSGALELIPWGWPARVYVSFWRGLVPWVGVHVLGTAPITIFPAGSGDTTYNYVEIVCFAAFALALTLLWSAVAWRATHHVRACAALRVYLRFLLGVILIGYGMAKVVPNQFPFPSPERMVATYGESSPMGLLWTFMGYSTAYNVFTGALEALGGVLLFYRRTTTLGALLACAVMANIVALNFCYDVPVKLYSSHLLVACAYLAGSDAQRLWNVLVANRPCAPAPARTTLPWRWAERARPWVASAFLGWILYKQVSTGLEYRSTLAARQSDRLYGAFDVRSHRRDDVELAEGDPQRWTRVTFNAWGYCTMQGVQGGLGSYRWEANGAELVTLFPQMASDAKGIEIETVWSDDDTLELAGELGGSIQIVQLEKRRFPLAERGFRWINEKPYNR